MGFRNIFLNKVSRSLVHILLFTYNSDSSPTTCCCRFHDVHISKVVHFAFLTKPLVIFREKISGGTNLKIFSISSSLSLDIPPQVTFVAHIPSASKMVNLLVLVHIFEFGGTDQASPEAIPSTSFRKPEASRFECVNDTIVCMG